MKIILKFVLICFVLAFISCDHLHESPLPKLEFTPIDASMVAARANANAFVLDNKAYILLGRLANINQGDGTDCWEYDASANVWSQKTSFPGKSRVGAIAEVVDGLAYVGLGYNYQKGVYDSDTTILDDLWQYNPNTDKWIQRASFPPHFNYAKPPLNACSSFSYKHFVYIVGLSNEKEYFNEVWRYDTKLDSWNRMNDFPGDKRQSGVACNDGESYFFGTGYYTYCRNDWWQYYPETDKWKRRQSIPTKGRVNAVAFSVNHRFFVATGRNVGGTLTDDYTHSDILEYDALKDKWYKRAEYIGGKVENALSFTLNGVVYMGFGEHNVSVFNQLWSFTP